MNIPSRVRIRTLGPVALIALLAVGTILPAAAQSPSIQKYGEPDKVKSQSDIAAEKEAEKAYQRSLGNIPAKQNVDPWGTVRSENSPPPKAAAAKAATAKPRSKPGEATNSAAKQ
jgi:hypothetical protein